MRSLFWKFFFSFWLLIAIIIWLSISFGRWLIEEHWLFDRYPGLSAYAEGWVNLYQQRGLPAAEAFSQERLEKYSVRVTIWNIDGQLILSLTPFRSKYRQTFPPNTLKDDEHSLQSRQHKRMKKGMNPSPAVAMQRFTEEYQSPDGETFIFHYAVPTQDFMEWQSRTLFWPVVITVILFAISFLSWILSAYIIRPVNRLRAAVSELGEGRYQSKRLKNISTRHDELGLLARDFNHMGQRLQELLNSQRQLLRAVSHELRSPLARMRIVLSMTERDAQNGRFNTDNWLKMEKECERLDMLIGEILSLSRLDGETSPTEKISLQDLFKQSITDQPDLIVNFNIDGSYYIKGWPHWLLMAFSNLLRNAVRFNPVDKPIDIRINKGKNHIVLISIQDHGPGCPPEVLNRLGEAFYRAPGQTFPGHGLGLTIVRRVVTQHGGTICFKSPSDDGLKVLIELPYEHNEPTPKIIDC